MSSSCGKSYQFNFDFIKSSSTSTLTSRNSSPSSTISETSNSTVFTKKPRTLRKRPNQTYNEAATLLSTAYPNLFSVESFKKPEKFMKPITEEYNDSLELLFPFRAYENEAFSFLLEDKPSFQTEPNKVFSVQEKPRCQLNTRVTSYDELESEDFDCESILDEEKEEGIDSVIGSRVDDNGTCGASCNAGERPSSWFGFGGKFSYVRALRHVDDGNNRWNFAVVDMLEISPGTKNTPSATEKKKKVVKKPQVELRDSNQGLLLKLNYDDVRNAWSDRGSPFADKCSGTDSPENDVTENGRVREASVLRYIEKRRTRLYSKKLIKYQVRKVKLDQRPTVKV